MKSPIVSTKYLKVETPTRGTLRLRAVIGTRKVSYEWLTPPNMSGQELQKVVLDNNKEVTAFVNECESDFVSRITPEVLKEEKDFLEQLKKSTTAAKSYRRKSVEINGLHLSIHAAESLIKDIQKRHSKVK